MPPAGQDCSLNLESVATASKRDDRADAELSSRSRENLSTLLSEGESMINKVEPSVIETWMQTVCSNGNLRSPLPAILCHEVRTRFEQDVNTKDVSTHSYRSLGELLARGKALLSIISEKTDVASVWRILEDISGTSPIATLLYYDFVSSMQSQASAQHLAPLTERMKGELATLLQEGRVLLDGLGTENSENLWSTIKQHATSSPLAKMLYLELLGQDTKDPALTERSQARLEELLSQGTELLAYLDEAQAEAIRSTIVQASGVSPVAAVLYKRLLSAASADAAKEGSVDREASMDSIAAEGRECLKEMLADGEHIMKEMSHTDILQSSKIHADDTESSAENKNLGSAHSRGRLGSLRMEFHDIKEVLSLHSDEFLEIIQDGVENGSIEQNFMIDAICSVSGMESVEREDVEEVVNSFSHRGWVNVDDLFSSLKLQGSNIAEDFDEDVGEMPNLSYVDTFIDKLIANFGDLEEAQVALQLDGMVYIAAFEHALVDHNVADVDVLRLLMDLGMEDEDNCFDAEEFCYLLHGNFTSRPENLRAKHDALLAEDEDQDVAEPVPEESEQESESDDEEFISILPLPDKHAQRLEGVPKAGMGLSVYTPGLESKVRALKGEIKHLDRRNEDPNIRGSRAWRIWNLERQLAAHTLEAKHTEMTPQSSQSVVHRQRSSSSAARSSLDRARARISRKSIGGDSVGPLVTLQRTPSTEALRRTGSSISTGSAASRTSSTGGRLRSRGSSASVTSEELPEALVKEIRRHRAEELAAAGGEQYREEHSDAVVKIQSLFRGGRDRSMVRPLLRQRVTSAISIIYFRKMKVSELNTIFRSVRDNDRVGVSLAIEAKQTQDILEAMFSKETEECEVADKKAEKELVELEQAEQEAEQEVQEANAAQERMQKEREEMLAWQAKADRYRTSYEQLKASRGIVDDQDDSLRVLHPDVFRERNQWQGIFQRYQREREQYEAAMSILIKERMESDKALYKAAQERKEWKEARAKALKERQEVEAFVLARKFTDPQVSLKERFRARVQSSADAPRYVRQTDGGKGREPLYMGVIQVDEENSYEGEFIVVKDQSDDELSRVFFSMSDEDDALDLEALQRAMLGVGRRLNLNEAERLVKSFDTDGNGTIEFDEFLAGFRRMVGMELPHGMGVERFGDGTLYEGEIFEDKRIGIGMYTTPGPDQQWYLGGWHLGYRQGKGIEGRFTNKGIMVPVAVVNCKAGKRKCTERFNPEKEWHLRMLRDYSLIVDTARKKASKSRILVQGDIQLGLNRKSAHAVEFERVDDTAGSEEEDAHEAEHERRSMDQDMMMVARESST